MNADVNVGYIKYISDDIYEMSKMITQIAQEMESVEKCLKTQSVFDAHLVALKKSERGMEERRNKLVVLSQALANIGSSYRQTEVDIENQFEASLPKPGHYEISSVDVPGCRQRLNSLLYGGGEHGNNL